MDQRILIIEASQSGIRLDRFLATQVDGLSRTQLQRLIDEGFIQVDGHAAKPSQKTEPGQQVTIAMPRSAAPVITAENIEIPVIYEDTDIIVVDKPAGMVVHPGHGAPAGTLVNGLLARYPELSAFEDSDRPGIVHRLDKDTSGVMVVARTPFARQNLQAQFAARTIHKRYWALIHGHLETAQALIDASIGRSRHRPTQMAIGGRADRAARTAYTVLERFEHFSLVEARPITGRTHQIRLHFAALGHPIAGDQSYGMQDEAIGLARQFLHAHALRLILPRSRVEREFESPLAPDLQGVLDGLRRSEGHPQANTAVLP
jgi:23S rRNA pseudouridine1911/1915/1917 synthase